jgi:hypothetical protein
VKPERWLFLSFILCARLCAQQAAELLGKVDDASGASLVNAKVEAVNAATGVSRTVMTDTVGDYRIAPLPPGTYTVTASFSGFKTLAQSGVILQVNQVARLDLTLEVGQVNQVTTVEARTPVVASENATIGAVIDNKKMVELPLNGRNFLDLARLTPGVAQATGAAGGVFINGGGSQSGNLLQIDGVDNFESPFGRPNIAPSVDMIQEFKLETALFSAEQGRAGIGQINIISKSGGNKLHGSAYEFHRNAKLAALNFFDLSREQRKAAGLAEIPPYIRNQFGFSLGGPIRKNKTFFFGNYEGNLIRQVARGVLTVPDANLRSGDFSARSTIIYDPQTLNPATNTRSPFPGNRIPSDRIDPVSRNIIANIPAPNTSGFVSNYVSTIGQRDNTHQFTTRVDHAISESDMIYGRYTYNKRDSLVPGYLGSVLFPGYGEFQNFPSHNVGINETHLFGPRTVNEVLVGFNRFFQNRYHEHQGQDVAGDLGLAAQSGIPLSQRIGGWPTVTVTGFAMPYEHPFAPLYQADNSFQIFEKLSHQFTRHSLKAGAELSYKRSPLDFHSSDRGNYAFSPRYATSAPLAPGVAENAFADFLLGTATSTSRAIGFPSNTTYQNWWSFFVQDDWRVHPNLTLNLGLRYELHSGAYERLDRFNTFCIDKAAFCRVGENGIPRPGYDRDLTNFAPRVGFAWRAFGTNKTVLRGGYGVFYDYTVSNRLFNMGQAPPWQFTDPKVSNPDVPNLTFRNPFPGALPSTPTAADQLTGTSVARDFKTAYVQQWSIGIQQEVFRDTVLEVAYVANRGIHTPTDWNLNYVTPGLGSVITRRPYERLNTVTYIDNSGKSWYDSMQVRVERAFRNGFTVTGAYTWAKSNAVGSVAGTQNESNGFRNPTNFAIDKGPGPADIRHRLVVSAVAELPFGRGKSLMSNAPKAIDYIFGGWQISAIGTFQSGALVTPSLSFDNSNAGGNRPDLIGDPNDHAPHTLQQWFDPSVFVNPPTIASVLASGGDPWRSIGNAGRGIIVGPGLNLWDGGVMKRFPLWRENHALQFRAEFFNAFNHPSFASPNATFPFVANQTGRITGTSVPNRTIQLALRYDF